MPKFRDLTGQKFGRLTALKSTHQVLTSGRRMVAWSCRCNCGNETTVLSVHITRGTVKSCGCLNSEMTSERSRTHGESKSADYRRWKAMIRRCHNPNVWNYKYYGARGIVVCNRWRFGDGWMSGFECFLADVGNAPEGKTIDRINNDGSYEPSNVRWASRSEQVRNSRQCAA